MKTKIRAAAAFMMILAVLLGQLVRYDVQASAEDVVKISMQIGFDKFYKIGFTTPIHFEIENDLRDINGELQIEIPGQNNSITVYAMNVSLPKGSVKKFLMNVPMTAFNTKLKVNLAEGKDIVSTKTFRVDPGSSGETYVIGILSDDYDSIRYINKLTVKNLNRFSTKNVRLDEDSFPEDINTLKTFNIIIINDFDTSKLSKAQYDALKKWVTGGGVLVIGTGPSQHKTLAAFKDDFITGEIGEIGEFTTSSLHEMAGSKTVETMLLSVSDISMEKGLPVIKDGDTILLQKIEKGRGVVGVASFDFGMEPVSTWIGNSAFADNAIAAMLPQYYFSQMMEKGIMAHDNTYAIENALKNIPELPLPKTSRMVFLYILYILLAAPISYFVLKRMDRREYMWITVPVLSIVFSAVVYISGVGTRITEPVTNVISIVDIDDSGTIMPRTYAGVFIPNKSSIRVEAGEDTDIRPLRYGNINYRGPISSDVSMGIVDSKVILSPKTVLEFYGSGVWSMKTLAMERDEILTGKVTSNLNYARGAFTGTIENNSGFDLEECYIITANQYADIGPLKNGEAKQIEVKPSSYFGQRYDLINAIYKDPYSGPRPRNQKKLTAEEIAVFRQVMQKRQVLEYALMDEVNQGFEAELLAWSSAPVAGELIVNGKRTKSYEKTLITSKLELSFRDGSNVEYPLGFLKPAIINNLSSGNYDDYGKTFYGRGSVEIHYTIDKSISPESIKTQYTVGNLQNVKQYIWDNEINDWAEGDYRSFDIHGDLLKRYIDSSNMLKLKIELEDNDVQLPQISVKGSVR